MVDPSIPTEFPPPREDPKLDFNELVEIFAQDMPTAIAAEEAARQVLDDHGEGIYTDLIWTLTNQRYDAPTAKAMWHDVVKHKYLVSERLGRNIGVRVAAIDYFTNIVGKLARPRVVDTAYLERLYQDATLDALTGLANRRHYRERLAEEIGRARRYANTFALAIFDLDDFKIINDTQGHAAGDRILQRVSEEIRRSMRSSDLGGRWGGEEFVLLMPETAKRGAIVVAERLRVRVENELSDLGLTISGGVACFPHDGEDEEAIFSFADRALYRAKLEGKNRICSTPMERRAYPRLDENLHVAITPLGESNGSIQTCTQNIGGGGLLFAYHQAIPVATEVRGEITIDRRTPQFVGRIVRIEEIAPDHYELGVQFLEIDPEDRRLILTFTM